MLQLINKITPLSAAYIIYAIFCFSARIFATSVVNLVRYVGPDRLQPFIARTRLQNYIR